MSDLYSWFKAIHLIAVIFWMAGLLYLPRLFVYHHQSKVCLLYTSPSPRDRTRSRMPSSA